LLKLASGTLLFGHLEILVVNAGILIHGTVDKYDLADFDRMVATEDVN
jgi:3-oxoacyl-[acyl-carrier protein] reductase